MKALCCNFIGQLLEKGWELDTDVRWSREAEPGGRLARADASSEDAFRSFVPSTGPDARGLVLIASPPPWPAQRSSD